MPNDFQSSSISQSFSRRAVRVPLDLLDRIRRWLGNSPQVWQGDNFIIGSFRGFHVNGFRYVGPDNKVRWQTVSSNQGPMHAYWVVGDGFFYTTGKIWKKRYRGDFLGPAATDVDPAERAAILEAIEKMGNSAPDAAIEIR